MADQALFSAIPLLETDDLVDYYLWSAALTTYARFRGCHRALLGLSDADLAEEEGRAHALVFATISPAWAAELESSRHWHAHELMRYIELRCTPLSESEDESVEAGVPGLADLTSYWLGLKMGELSSNLAELLAKSEPSPRTALPSPGLENARAAIAALRLPEGATSVEMKNHADKFNTLLDDLEDYVDVTEMEAKQYYLASMSSSVLDALNSRKRKRGNWEELTHIQQDFRALMWRLRVEEAAAKR